MFNRSIVLMFCLFFCMNGYLVAQEDLRVKRKGFVTSSSGAGKALQKIKKADRMVLKGEGFRDEALSLYLDAANYNHDNAVLNYKIGVSYLTCGPKANAQDYFKKAFSIDPDVSRDIHYMLGYASQMKGDLVEAVDQYKANMEKLKQRRRRMSSVDRKLFDLCERRIQECLSGQKLFADKCDVVVERLPEPINSKADEYYPFVMSDSLLVFTSRRDAEKKVRLNPLDGKSFERVFSVNSVGDEWSDVEEMNSRINSERNVGVRGILGADEWVVFKGSEDFGEIYKQRRGKKRWRKSKKISKVSKRKSHEASASLTADGQFMYFVSDRKGGFGKHDIYVAKRKKHGGWKRPKNLGDVVNTKYDEADVFVSSDGKTLYFSSRGHNTIGGFDIFSSTQTADGEWSKPVNMGVPVNSTANDISFSLSKEGNWFFFASERDGGAGGYDLYASKKPKPAPKKIDKKEEPIILNVSENQIDADILVAKSEPLELIEEAMTYRVQIAACRNELSAQDLLDRYKGSEDIDHLIVGNWHRYTIGRFKDYQEASKLLSSCGVKDAFVVLFKGRHRLGLAKKP